MLAEWTSALAARRSTQAIDGVTASIFIFGAGYSAKAFAPRRAARQIAIAGTTRSPEKFDALRAGRHRAACCSTASAVAASLRTALATADAPRSSPSRPTRPATRCCKPARRRLLQPHAAAALDRLSLDRRRLWRPWRRLGRRNERMPAGLAPLRAAARSRAGLAGARARQPACRWRSCGFPAFTVRAATPSSISPTAPPGGWSSPARCSTASMSTTSPARSGISRSDDQGGIFNVTDDLPAPPQDVVAYAAGIDGRRAAARNSLRDRPTFAHGAVLLWREQARLERGDQGGRLSLPLSRLPFGVRRHVGGGETGRARAKRMRAAR